MLRESTKYAAWLLAVAGAGLVAFQSCQGGGENREHPAGTDSGDIESKTNDGEGDTAEPTADPTGATDDDSSDAFVTVGSGDAAYRIFTYEASLSGTKARSVTGVQPAVEIDYAGAKKACEAAGYRLCTLEEWVKACKGPSDLKYAVAATVDGSASDNTPAVDDVCDVARTTNNTPGSLPSAAGDFPDCVTKGTALQNMIGNVSEWATNGSTPVAAGVAFYQDADVSTCDAQLEGAGPGGSMPPDEQSTDLGFRCCASAAP